MTRLTDAEICAASLSQLLAFYGFLPCVEIVEHPSAHDPLTIENALDEVERLLCPFPAKKVKPWFWTDTNAGYTIRVAQWAAFGHEALWPNSTARLLYGSSMRGEKIRLNTAVKKGKLRAYRVPYEMGKVYKIQTPKQYFRHSRVLIYLKQLQEERLEWERRQAE